MVKDGSNPSIPEEFLKPYDSSTSEPEVIKLWDESGYANPDKMIADGLIKPDAEAYTIVLPPPNVTGTLHMGHAYEDSLQDAFVRIARMQGKRTLWIPGTDSAAIATQSKVEGEIYKKEKKTRYDIGRDELMTRIEAFTEESKATITSQVRALGASLDWSRYAYTMDEPRYHAVMTAFVRMFEAGLIYRGDRIVNWDPKSQTTVADDEIEHVEQKDPFYYFQYGPFVIGTVRPETKFGDKYVVMHPKDERYMNYKHGQQIDLEWINGPITATVIKDEAADIEVGSGVMTITPAHSVVDFEIAQRHGLDIEQVIDEKGILLPIAGEFAGQHIKKARPLIVEKLREKGLVVKVDDEYIHNIAISYRGGGIIEPQIKRQWFVHVNKEFVITHSEIPGIASGSKTTLKGVMKTAVESGAVKILPAHFEKIYYHWIDNLRDWCISRQIWFGHRIPVYYCGDPDTKRMGFAGDVVPQVFAGKTSTWRLRDHGFKPGNVIAFEDSSTKKIFGYGTVTDVEVTTVGGINLQDRLHFKTYDSRDELIAAFKRHNPHKEVTPGTPVWSYIYTFDQTIKKGACGAITASIEGPEKCPTCGAQDMYRDPDTLDTWFSSGLWTFSTLGWPEETPDLKTYHPTTLMAPGCEILFFWVARMILMSGFLIGQVPFRDVYLHGIVRDKQGRKFSKSLGNGIDPLDLIKQYGADAVRMSLLISAAPGNDIKYDEQRVRGYKMFANKLWNISRFVFENTTNVDSTSPLTEADTALFQEATMIARSMSENIEKFRLDLAADTIYHYIWDRFAAEILEESKITFKGNNADTKASRARVLYEILTMSLKLLHPFMPFVTEAIWQKLPERDAQLLMVARWP